MDVSKLIENLDCCYEDEERCEDCDYINHGCRSAMFDDIKEALEILQTNTFRCEKCLFENRKADND